MIKIISDSTCDLSPDLIEKYQISILPLHILLGDKEHNDGVDITPDEIYRWSDENNTTPKTSAPGIDMAIDLMRPFLEQNQELICFAISESMSTSANVMRMAGEELDAADRVHVVDSANLSTGIGLLVIRAAIMALEGESVQTILSEMERLKPLVRASFVVDTLVYLHRGGRCGGLAAMLGGALKLHPTIVVEDGRMISTKKYRGKISRVISEYVKDRTELMQNACPDRVFITHSGCDAAVIEAAEDYIKSLGIFDEILVTRAGGVISSHCGPGTLGVLFIEKE